jgi:hypothetical protein
MRGEGEGPGSSSRAAPTNPHGHVATRLFSTPSVAPQTGSIPASRGDATPNVGASRGDATPNVGASRGDATPNVGASRGDATPPQRTSESVGGHVDDLGGDDDFVDSYPGATRINSTGRTRVSFLVDQDMVPLKIVQLPGI